MAYCTRHFTYFRIEDGRWLGEWRGYVPSPPTRILSLVGDQRTLAMNAWAMDVQRTITPDGSPYRDIDQAWDLEEWHACPAGMAVCVDTTQFNWPVGDQYWHRWNAIDQAIEYPEPRHYLQIDTRRREIVANTTSSRPIRASFKAPDTNILDITGSSLQEFHGSLLGSLDHQDDRRWVLLDVPQHLSDGIQHELDANSTTVDRALGEQYVNR
jgi:hypothetical protein|tara:strand:- start:1912 stop:2547 length:636 start_codon:yes stop_codon:yes gene_type:complete